MNNKKTIEEIMEQVVILVPAKSLYFNELIAPSEKERIRSNFLQEVVRNVYKEELDCSKVRIEHATDRSSYGFNHRYEFPAIKPGESTTYFTNGFTGCFLYLISKFGKEKESESYHLMFYPWSRYDFDEFSGAFKI